MEIGLVKHMSSLHVVHMLSHSQAFAPRPLVHHGSSQLWENNN